MPEAMVSHKVPHLSQQNYPIHSKSDTVWSPYNNAISIQNTENTSSIHLMYTKLALIDFQNIALL